MYRYYALSCLQFVAQVVHPPADIRKHEAAAIEALIGGPHGWITLEAMHGLRRLLPFAETTPSIKTCALAARGRTALVTLPVWSRAKSDIERALDSDHALVVYPLRHWTE